MAKRQLSVVNEADYRIAAQELKDTQDDATDPNYPGNLYV